MLRTQTHVRTADEPEGSPKPSWSKAAVVRLLHAGVTLLRPTASASWNGAAIGAATASLLFGGAVGASNPTGLGLLGGFALGVLLGGVFTNVCSLPLAGLLLLGKSGRWLQVAVLLGSIGSVLALCYLINGIGGLVPGLVIAVPFVLLMAALGSLVSPTRMKPAFRWSGVVTVLLVGSAGGVWLSANPQTSLANDASHQGPYTVRSLTYGSGSDSRPEYGEQAAIQSQEVDGSGWIRGWNGRRTGYWGFGPERLPLNGIVWVPDSPGPFPLVLIVHGNHPMEKPSETGYAYLGEMLASHGYVAASIDQNFLNGSWRGDIQGDVEVRSWLLLEHVNQWRQWNADPDHPFFGLIDTDQIVLIGHSRGGEAIVGAAYLNHLSHRPNDATIRLDYGHSIRALVAIAPSEGFYRPAGHLPAIQDIPYLQFWGSHDADMLAFQGSRAYEQISYSGRVPGFKASAYIYGANHGQFNTEWGAKDGAAPLRWLVSTSPLISGESQREFAKLHISAFLEAVLHHENDHLRVFLDHTTSPDHPAAYWRFQDSKFRLVAGYREDGDPATLSLPDGIASGQGLTLWREEKARLRDGEEQGSHAVRLSWGDTPSTYEIRLPEGGLEGWALTPSAALVLSVAVISNENPVAFRVELEDAHGRSRQIVLEASRPPAVELYKVGWLERRLLSTHETVFQTHALPLEQYQDIDVSQLSAIRFHFGESPGEILVNSIGFHPLAPGRKAA